MTPQYPSLEIRRGLLRPSARSHLNASDTNALKSIQFTIAPKAGSVTRPVSGTYSKGYLIQRGFLSPGSGEISLPVYGLYSGFNNTVSLRYFFNDGSSEQASTAIATASLYPPVRFRHSHGLAAQDEQHHLKLRLHAGNRELHGQLLPSDLGYGWRLALGEPDRFSTSLLPFSITQSIRLTAEISIASSSMGPLPTSATTPTSA